MLVNNGNDFIPDDIWEYIQSHMGEEWTSSKMEKALNRGPSVIHRHLGKLVRCGMVRRRMECTRTNGNKKYVYFFPEGEAQHE